MPIPSAPNPLQGHIHPLAGQAPVPVPVAPAVTSSSISTLGPSASLSKTSSSEAATKPRRVVDIFDSLDQPEASTSKPKSSQREWDTSHDPFATLYDPFNSKPISRPSSSFGFSGVSGGIESGSSQHRAPLKATTADNISAPNSTQSTVDIKPKITNVASTSAPSRIIDLVDGDDSDVEVLSDDAIPDGMRKVTNRDNPISIDDDDAPVSQPPSAASAMYALAQAHQGLLKNDTLSYSSAPRIGESSSAPTRE